MNLITPINDLGYGVVGKNIARELFKIDPTTKLYLLGNTPSSGTKEEAQMFEQGKCVDRTKPDLRIWHEFDMGYFVSNKRKMGLTFFELDRLSKQEVSHLNSLDVLFVPSKWHFAVARNCGVINPKIVVLPMSVDPDIFPAIKTEYRRFLGYDNSSGSPVMKFDEPPKDQPTVFMACGKWEIRKGHDILIECFEQAFSADDNVKLIANCFNPFIENNDQWIDRYLARRPHQIDVIPERLNTQYDLANIFAQVDCGVFPARSEGFNMEAAELLAMGKHCIMTNYSGHTSYCSAAGASLIDFQSLEVADDGVFFQSNNPKWEGNPGKWMEITQNNKKTIIDSMQRCHILKGGGRNEEGISYFKNWTWAKIAKTIYKEAYAS